MQILELQSNEEIYVMARARFWQFIKRMNSMRTIFFPCLPKRRQLVALMVFSFAAPGMAFSQTAVQSRIVQAVNSGQMTILQGNIHPRARIQYDQGTASPDMQIQGVSRVFKLSSSQQTALD